jgi:hypothetical protein
MERKLHNGELYFLFSSLNIIGVIRSRKMILAVQDVAMRNVYRLRRDLEGRKPFGRLRRSWEDNIKADLK